MNQFIEQLVEIDSLMYKKTSNKLTFALYFNLFLLLAFFGVVFLIPYPEKLTGRIEITYKSPPIFIKAINDGLIEDIFFENNSIIVKNASLLLINSEVNYQNLMKLISTIEKNKKLNFDDYNLSDFQVNELGSIQQYLNDFLRVAYEFKTANASTVFASKKTLYIQQKEFYDNLESKLLEKRNLFISASELVAEELKDNKKLYNNGVISRTDYFKEIINNIEKKALINELDVEIVENKLLLNKAKNEIEIDNVIKNNEINKLKNEFSHKLFRLQSSIKEWEQSHLIKSPISGVLNFTSIFHVGNNISKGEGLFVVTEKSNHYIGMLKIKSENSGALDIGQQVKIGLDNYPSFNSGFLYGEVTSISQFPIDKQYLVQVSIPDNLITSYGKKLPNAPVLEGNGYVIVKNRSLFKRMFSETFNFID